MKPVFWGLLLFLVVLPAVSPAQESEPTAFEFSLIQTGRGLTMHKEMGVLPFTYAEEYHGAQTEVIFKLSAKHDLFGSRLYLAYSQKSFWQAYDNSNSAPFRDTNYNPEIFYRFKEQKWGSGFYGGDAGFEHESNGQRMPLSRSWNLLYLAPFYHADKWMTYVKLRYRIPEDEKETPISPEGDDNPDITDYLGYSDIHLYFALPKGQLIHFLMRGYIGTDKGNISLDYSIPIPSSESGCLWMHFFNGYGESMLDYDKHITRIGIGILFNR
jgi:phospholipase A1